LKILSPCFARHFEHAPPPSHNTDRIPRAARLVKHVWRARRRLRGGDSRAGWAPTTWAVAKLRAERLVQPWPAADAFQPSLLRRSGFQAQLRPSVRCLPSLIEEELLRDNHAMMQVHVEDIQRDLAAYLQRVEAGETVVIVRAGQPVVEMRPV